MLWPCRDENELDGAAAPTTALQLQYGAVSAASGASLSALASNEAGTLLATAELGVLSLWQLVPPAAGN
jgi:hypothetical protein